jgi:hypothetical protein
MELSFSWESNSHSSSQEYPNILWYPKFHYRVNKISLTVCILSLKNPNPCHPYCFPTIYLNIVLLFPTEPSMHFSPPCVTCFVHLSLLDLITIIMTDKDYKLRSFSLCSFPQPLSSFSVQMWPPALCSGNPWVYVYLLIWKPNFTTIRKFRDKIIFLYISIFTFCWQQMRVIR